MTVQEREELRELYPFIAGQCRIWCRARQGDDRYWFHMTYPASGHDTCLKRVTHYQEEWGNFYEYRITADSDLCNPLV